MKNLKTIFIPLALLLYVACDSDSGLDAGPDAEPEKFTVKTDNYTFYADKERFTEADARRADKDYCDVPTKIKRVQRNDNLLAVTVSIPKNCEPSYEVIWNGLILESFPVQITLFLKVLGECTDNGEFEQHQVVLDLEEIFTDESSVNPAEANFTVKDACSLLDVACESDCDITVSN